MSMPLPDRAPRGPHVVTVDVAHLPHLAHLRRRCHLVHDGRVGPAIHGVAQHLLPTGRRGAPDLGVSA